MKSEVQVFAALIMDRGRFFMGQRPSVDSHPLCWEFPGGKGEVGESAQQALARELSEELGIIARIGRELAQVSFEKGSKTLNIRLFLVESFEGFPCPLYHAEHLWLESLTLIPNELTTGSRLFLEKNDLCEFIETRLSEFKLLPSS